MAFPRQHFQTARSALGLLRSHLGLQRLFDGPKLGNGSDQRLTAVLVFRKKPDSLSRKLSSDLVPVSARNNERLIQIRT